MPQLLNEIDGADVDYFLNNHDYIAQEKKDGERRLLVADDRIIGLNKKGQPVPLPNSIVKSNNGVCTLDGEIIGEKLFVFDILSMDGEDLKERTCIERLSALHTIKFGKGIEVVKTAYSTIEKRKLYEELKGRNAEGIVFKLKNAPYTSGRPNSGGSQLKHKFYAEATFIVSNRTEGKRSVGLELIGENKERVFVGKVTIPPNKEIPNEGDLVEVRYLYAYKGGAIFQSVYKDKRNDSDLTDATTKQLKYKAEVEA